MKPLRAMLYLLAVLLIFGGASAFAAGDTETGNHYLPHCQHAISDRNSYDVWDGECTGIIKAIIFYAGSFPPNKAICFPKKITNGQAYRVVVRYLENNPDKLHLDFMYLASDAMRQAWPCKMQ